MPTAFVPAPRSTRTGAEQVQSQRRGANAEGIAGSSDERTPLGAQEGMSCTDCHKGHGRKADPARGRCPHKPRKAG